MLKYAELKEKPKEFLAATGLTDEEFQCLLPTFELSDKCEFNQRYRLLLGMSRKTS